jgi:hypothetical protein
VVRIYRQGIASLLGDSDRPAGEITEQDLPPLISQATPAPAAAIWCQDGHLRHALPAEKSCILVRRGDGTMGGILVSLRLARSTEEVRALLAQESEPADSGAGTAALGLVIHSLAASNELTDLRSGLVVPANPSADQTRAFLLSALPLPAEFHL